MGAEGGGRDFVAGVIKGVGPSTTLAWPGWKQPDIAVDVDTARLEYCVNQCKLCITLLP